MNDIIYNEFIWSDVSSIQFYDDGSHFYFLCEKKNKSKYKDYKLFLSSFIAHIEDTSLYINGNKSAYLCMVNECLAEVTMNHSEMGLPMCNKDKANLSFKLQINKNGKFEKIEVIDCNWNKK